MDPATSANAERSPIHRSSFHESPAADFTANSRMVLLALLAIPIGVGCSFIALLLQRMIGLFTNIFYYHSMTIPETLIEPSGNSLGWCAILVPVLGGLVIGLMARYGSDRIRGHGIPEAIDAILIGRSRMDPKVAILKPLSSAISIGSGGPFGAEGPIIMTGGAFGSIVAQIISLTSAERKTLLVAGAAAGMSATFGTPVAAVLLAVELLLFEWKPRSLVPVAIASATASAARSLIGLDAAPLFAIAMHVNNPTILRAACSAFVGLTAGLLSVLLTTLVYAAEDLFQKLPIHWMWWPALGGIIVGIGGMIEPRALGVGYSIIRELANGECVPKALALLLIVKGTIWICSLGSGTSGGVLAPLLIMGGILGALEAGFLPTGDRSLWALVGMAAIMGGTMRSPLTGVIFAFELTYDAPILVSLLIASTCAHALTVLVLRRSILTEKVARRGYHVSREYSVDPLEQLNIGDVMTTNIITIPASLRANEVLGKYFLAETSAKHQGYPVVDASNQLLGVITKSDLLQEWIIRTTRGENTDSSGQAPIIAYDLIHRAPITAETWESCRTAAERMARSGVGRLLVIAPDNRRILGIITRSDLLKARTRVAEEELDRQRFLSTNLWNGKQTQSKQSNA